MENHITKNDIISFVESLAKDNNYDIESKEFLEFVTKEDQLATSCEMEMINVDYSNFSREEYEQHKQVLEVYHIRTGLYFAAKCYLLETYTY